MAGQISISATRQPTEIRMPLFVPRHSLSIGDPAPGFELPDQDERIHRLEDYRDDWLVLFFYPRDMTAGCTKEVCEFRDNYDYFLMTNISLLGISTDSPQKHHQFRSQHGLGFPLLSDVSGEVARAYGSLLRIGPLRQARRHSFIIDPDGDVVKIYRKVNPQSHGFEIVQQLHDLTSGM